MKNLPPIKEKKLKYNRKEELTPHQMMLKNIYPEQLKQPNPRQKLNKLAPSKSLKKNRRSLTPKTSKKYKEKSPE